MGITPLTAHPNGHVLPHPVSSPESWKNSSVERGEMAERSMAVVFFATRVLRGLLFETEPLDPVTLGTASLVLVGAAVVATWLPARRAMRVDPIEVLRAQ